MSPASCFIFLIFAYLGRVFSYTGTDEEIARFEAFYEYLGSNGTFREADIEPKGTESPVINTYEYKGVASLQRAPGYQLIGLPVVFVHPKFVLAITIYAELLKFALFRKKGLVVVSGLTPNILGTGKVHKVTDIFSDPRGFALIKVTGKSYSFSKPAPPNYRFSKFDNYTIVKWKGITSLMVKIAEVKYKSDEPCTLLGIPAPSYIGCLTQENLFITDVCAPVFSKSKRLVGMVVVPSLGLAGSEYIYKISDIVKDMATIVNANK